MTTGAGATYIVRLVEAHDRSAVARELAAYLAHIGEELDVDGLDHDIAHWEREYGGGVGALLVVEDPTGEIVGTAGVRTFEPGVGEIKRMWIQPRCQGLGLGRRLMVSCLERAKALGFRHVRLDTERKMTAALGLYRSSGFREIDDYNGNSRAQVWMELAL